MKRILVALVLIHSSFGISARANEYDDRRLCTSRASSGELYNALTDPAAPIATAREKALSYCQAEDRDPQGCSPAVCEALDPKKPAKIYQCQIDSPSLAHTAYSFSNSFSEAKEGAQWECIQKLSYEECKLDAANAPKENSVISRA